MAVFDTGPIDNRTVPRTTALTIRLFNTGRLPALVGVEVYFITPTGAGFADETFYVLQVSPLQPLDQPNSSFTLDNVFADLDVFGVRVITSGLGADNTAVTVIEKDSGGVILRERVLEGALTRIQEHLFAYVPNQISSTLTVINTGTNTLLPPIPLPAGTQLEGIAITPDGLRAYVANRNGSIIVINTSTNTILTTIPLPLGSDPNRLAVTPDGTKVYVSNFQNDSVIVIDALTNSIITTIPVPPAGSRPFALAITPDSSRVYVTRDAPDAVTVIDTATNSILTTINAPADTNFLGGIAITPNGLRAYVTDNGNSMVIVIDITTNTILTTINLPVGSNPNEIAINPDGSRAYVSASGTSDSIIVINLERNSILTTIELPALTGPGSIAVTPQGTQAYVITNISVLVIDTLSNTVIGTLPAVAPSDIAITPILLF